MVIVYNISGATTPCQSGPEIMAMKGYSTFPEAPSVLEPQYHVTYSYADACRNILNTIMTNGHSSLEKYTPHFIR